MILVNRIGAILLLLVFVLLLNMACGGDSGTTPTATEEAEQEPAVQETQDAPDEPEAQDSTEEEGEKELQWRTPPEMEIDSSKAYNATFKMENGTEFVVELYAGKVPVTVNNFVFLARQGYYDGTTFHRVIPGFMAQAGDPSGTGSGGPGYAFDNEFHPDLSHVGPGILSMANSGIRNGSGTNGSQFFITFTETKHLDGLNPNGTPKDCTVRGASCHSVFGKVIEGMNAVLEISTRDPQRDRDPGDRIESVTITER